MKDMLGREAPISVEKARALLPQHAPFQRTAEICLAIEDFNRMITSSDIFSPENLPSFSRTTVDGYAVNSADTFGARETLPAYLSYQIFMGDNLALCLQKARSKSGLITALTKTDGTAVIPLMKLGIHKGELVTVRLF